MTTSSTSNVQPFDTEKHGCPETMVRFLSSLFQPEDRISIRPIETWDDVGGEKKRKVDFRGLRWPMLLQLTEPESWYCTNLLGQTYERKTNLFFGVAPRFGGQGWYEKKWQIRTIRALWSDVDHTTVPDALKKVEQARLPRPSVIVSSGNGAHFYWLLTEAYLIDDVGDPPKVETEWVNVETKFSSKGKNIKVEYFTNQYGERVNLTNPKTGIKIPGAAPELSPKGLLAEEVMQGIAAGIGGDATHDISRLLRIAGSRHRKNQRNTGTSKPCELVELNETRYPFELFLPFAERSPVRANRIKASKMALPSHRKMTPKREDNLAQRIAACEIAEDRSRADYSLCCYAVEQGILADELFERVHDKGKFSERGREYFDRTWAKAEDSTRVRLYNKLAAEEQRKDHDQHRQASLDADDDNLDQLMVVNPEHETHDQSGDVEQQIKDRLPLAYDPQLNSVRWLLTHLTGTLARSGEVFTRANRPCLIRDDRVYFMDEPSDVAAVFGSVREFQLVEDRGEAGYVTKYEPLPSKYGTMWLKSPPYHKLLPPVTLFTRNPIFMNTSTGWRLSSPGYDNETGVYYAGDPITPIVRGPDDVSLLDELLKGFCWKHPADRANYLGMLLTPMLMRSFVGGNKPALLLNGNQPNLGKSKLAQIMSIMRCGKTVTTVTYIDRDEELEKRFGANVRAGDETIIVDNAKTEGNRIAVISSAVMERFVTDPIVSFRLLGSSTNIQAENLHILIITANSAKVSNDITTRSIPVNLFYEGDTLARRFDISPEDFAFAHRSELLGELLGMVQVWIDSGCPMVNADTRFEAKKWGGTIGGILKANREDDFLANAAEAANAMSTERLEFAALVDGMATQTLGVAWTAEELVRLAKDIKAFQEITSSGTDRGQHTAMGLIMTRFINTTFIVEVYEAAGKIAKEVMLIKGATNGKTVYRLKPVSDTSQRSLELKPNG